VNERIVTPELATVEPTRPASSPWLDVKEAAQHAHVGVGLIYRAVASRRLRHVRVGERRHGLLRFRAEWVDSWLDSQAAGVEVPPTQGRA
jgi:excisionase family DNA binding protein